MVGEDWDTEVKQDLEDFVNRVAPESHPYIHNYEGSDDMPAHIKNMLIGCDITIPIIDGKLGLGKWQGIYLCEHRDSAGPRNVVMTIHAT